jgi:hypothetical protein
MSIGIPLIAEIGPKNNGSFAMLDDVYMRGGLRVVSQLADRDAITADRRKEGMLVLVTGDSNNIYILTADLVTWALAPLGTGGGGTPSLETITVIATEAIADGDFVNIWNNNGVRQARLASATNASKPAHGFATAAAGLGSSATIALRGANTHIPGGTFTLFNLGANAFLSPTVPGKSTSIRPTGSGQVVQILGTIDDISLINFSEKPYTILI